MSESTEIKGVIPNYYSFIVDKLNQIAYAENRYDYPAAIHITLNLCNYLPRILKEKIRPEADRIRKRLNTEAVVEGFFTNSIQRNANKQYYRIAAQEEPKLIDKITTLLDENKLLTQSYGVPTRKGNLTDIGDKLS